MLLFLLLTWMTINVTTYYDLVDERRNERRKMSRQPCSEFFFNVCFESNRHSYRLPFKYSTCAVSKEWEDTHILLLIHIMQWICCISYPYVTQVLFLVPSVMLLHLQACGVPSAVTLTDRDEALFFYLFSGVENCKFCWTVCCELVWLVVPRTAGVKAPAR